ncbi:potassium-transporting ATPase subunit C [Skermanella stibiiresistens SB22]|uniref:Potassium-transporting ATPase KdpC subunit n=1 Tax=Skermanella stibiiresistens SB22 TaxID=1385369 RepID=W9HCH3_9PROT|nr:potassium-transporting ATPase subunit KdpC [Skermanella stibiiresistens]EWY42436.1 potassium-transporting ATPase subunit C [Skermanella stibiiresistens SB22]
MLKELKPALMMLVVLTIITGALYPLAVSGLAWALFPTQAHGSLVTRDGEVVGSTLIAQGFTEPGHFQPRPSAADYKAEASGASNYGPTSGPLIDQVKARIDALRAANPDAAARGPIPVELVTASGSGLDPHLSPGAALWQAPRIAAARGIPEAQLRTLVSSLTEGRTLGLFGEPRVNVLALNLALDALPAVVPDGAEPPGT